MWMSIHGVSVQCSVSVRTVWMSKHGHHLVLKIRDYWILLQTPLSDPLGSPLTGYLLQYQVHDLTSTIQLPALNTSYTLDSVPSGAAYNITVSALSNVGSSRNNPSVQFGKFDMPYQGCMPYGDPFKPICTIHTSFYPLCAVVPSVLCEDSWATPES